MVCLILKIEIINLYNDIAPNDCNFIANHGQAFLIKSESNQTLFDTGQIGKYLLHNMKELAVDPNEIDTVVISHGHLDHSGGLNELIRARTTDEILTVIAHPESLLPKGGYKTKEKKEVKDASFPLIPEDIKDKVNLLLVKEPYQITDYLATVGEVNHRPFKDGTSDSHVFFEDEKWKPDKMIDDLNLVVQTKDGLVIVCGCCHAGLLNTLEQVSNQYPGSKINAILGGTHMTRYSGEEVEFVAKGLIENYDKPKLYFNHCSGKNVIDQLLEIFGPEIVDDCLIGKKLEFNY
ncbi:MAG: MBL fold metallo-hydrolase [Asgard group archaeon]|nr:MBL fold metallo-hydrolase [Asgard group archaeon]